MIFDEVKTGAAVAAGGMTELFGVTPDVVCLAKAMCGGLPGGAIGMTDALAELVAAGQVKQQGTFNGNPLTMAAAQATLLDVLTPDAYKQLHAANEKLMAGCERVIAEYGLPAHTVGLGSKGCVVMSSEPVREYRDYLTKIHHDLTDLAWLYHMNNGIFMTPGQDEEWTLSVLHTDADLQRYVDVFETFARDVDEPLDIRCRRKGRPGGPSAAAGRGCSVRPCSSATSPSASAVRRCGSRSSAAS